MSFRPREIKLIALLTVGKPCAPRGHVSLSLRLSLPPTVYPKLRLRAPESFRILFFRGSNDNKFGYYKCSNGIGNYKSTKFENF